VLIVGCSNIHYEDKRPSLPWNDSSCCDVSDRRTRTSHVFLEVYSYTTQHNTAQYSTTQHNTTQHNATKHNTTQHNAKQHNTTQHNAAQHNITQSNTTQHTATQHNATHFGKVSDLSVESFAYCSKNVRWDSGPRGRNTFSFSSLLLHFVNRMRNLTCGWTVRYNYKRLNNRTY
jgi:hypothetical protein